MDEGSTISRFTRAYDSKRGNINKRSGIKQNVTSSELHGSYLYHLDTFKERRHGSRLGMQMLLL